MPNGKGPRMSPATSSPYLRQRTIYVSKASTSPQRHHIYFTIPTMTSHHLLYHASSVIISVHHLRQWISYVIRHYTTRSSTSPTIASLCHYNHYSAAAARMLPYHLHHHTIYVPILQYLRRITIHVTTRSFHVIYNIYTTPPSTSP